MAEQARRATGSAVIFIYIPRPPPSQGGTVRFVWRITNKIYRGEPPMKRTAGAAGRAGAVRELAARVGQGEPGVENIHRHPTSMSITRLECQVSESVNNDTRPRPTTQVPMEALRVELTAELEVARARPRRRQHCHSTLSFTGIDPSLRPLCTATRDRRISHAGEEGRGVMGGAAPPRIGAARVAARRAGAGAASHGRWRHFHTPLPALPCHFCMEHHE
jgi:hypothetical protein